MYYLKTEVGGIFCDLAEASDCVNHKILLAKLQCYGIQGTVSNWFRSCLTDRRQGTEIESLNEIQNFFSNWGTVGQGFLQGLIL
jgi:hypothetical protein